MLNHGGELSDAQTILIVADVADAAARAEAEIATLKSCNAARTSWRDAAAVTADTGRLAAVFADAEGVADDDLIDSLIAIGVVIDVPLIVAFAPHQIDLVCAAMLPIDTRLLCDAGPVVRLAALMEAVFVGGNAIHDTSRDARRLQRINEEVTRFAETLARLARTDGHDGAVPSSVGTFVADPGSAYGTHPIDIDPTEIRREIRGRRLRDDAFDLPGLFEEPAWDMLLDLFASELERRRVSVSSLCIAAAVAPTTALRWIGKLVEAGMLDRRPDELDRRRAFISLTGRASTAMRNYVLSMRRAGLHFA